MKTEEGKQELVFNYLHGKSNPTSQKSPPKCPLIILFGSLGRQHITISAQSCICKLVFSTHVYQHVTYLQCSPERAITSKHLGKKVSSKAQQAHTGNGLASALYCNYNMPASISQISDQ